MKNLHGRAVALPHDSARGGKKFFPCESVVCAGEIKSALTSKRDIKKAFENLVSVKKLDRSAGGRNFALIDEMLIDQTTNHLDQIFTFLFRKDHDSYSKAFKRLLRDLKAGA